VFINTTTHHRNSGFSEPHTLITTVITFSLLDQVSVLIKCRPCASSPPNTHWIVLVPAPCTAGIADTRSIQNVGRVVQRAHALSSAAATALTYSCCILNVLWPTPELLRDAVLYDAPPSKP